MEGRPSSVQTVFPLREETKVKTANFNQKNRGPVIVFNMQTQDHDSQIRSPAKGDDVDKAALDVLKQFEFLEATIGPDFDLLIITEQYNKKGPKEAEIRKAVGNIT